MMHPVSVRRGAKRATALWLCGCFWIVAGSGIPSSADEPANTNGAAILDTYSYWRAFVTLRPILFGTAEKAEPHANGRTAAQSYSRPPTLPPDGPKTPLPPADWMQPDFDDSSWWMDPGPFFGGKDAGMYGVAAVHLNRYGLNQPSTLALLCVRGKFTVTDPGQVTALRLSLEYRGGVVVYLNGNEVKRLHLREGEINPLTLAEDYPLSASMMTNGALLNASSIHRNSQTDQRVRTARDVELPVKHLRKGVNVLAVEVHRCAMPIEMATVHPYKRGATSGWFWNTAGLMETKLNATGTGIVGNTRRPKGLQVWNANPLETVFTTDYGEPHEPLRPIRIVGTRNGCFSGQAVLGSSEPLRGLSAEVSALRLKGGAGTIPASNVAVLWPQPTILNDVQPKAAHPPFDSRRNPIGRFEALEEKAPAEVAVWKKHPAGGAVQPVWLSVRVPGDAAPGDYEGSLTIGVAGAEPIRAPVALQVHGFRLPDPTQFETWVDFIPTPESLAFYYKTPMWSEEHWRLIERSLRMAAGMGNKTLYIPLIKRTNLGNAETMVRWIRDPSKDGAPAPSTNLTVSAGSTNLAAQAGSAPSTSSGQASSRLREDASARQAPQAVSTNPVPVWVAGKGYRHDFSIAERYLDTALKAGLKPQAVCLQVWDYHIGMNTEPLGPRESFKIGTGMYEQLTVKEPQPVPVSLLDPATNKIQELLGPKYIDPGAEEFWTPVAAGMLDAIRKRGLEKSLMLGLAGDYVPPKATVHLWQKLLPEARWITMAHGRASKLWGVPVGYSTTVFGAAYAVDPEVKRFYGWKNAEVVAYFPRFGNPFPPTFERLAFEKGISGNMRGMGRQSLDDFARRATSWGSSGCCWGSLTLAPCWLAPGTNGAISTVRFEMGREGIQECEARIVVEKALADDALRAKLGDALAAKCQAMVDERTRSVILADEKGENGMMHTSMPGGPLGYDWFAGSDWQTRSAKLYAAAAEVAKALGGK